VKRHHNTLYVTTQGAYVGAEGETVVVRVERAKRLQMPLHVLEGIVCFGRVSCSPDLMGRCSERGIGVSFFTARGRFLARVVGPVSGNVLLRRAQYKAADDAGMAARIARSSVLAKVANARAVLLRSLRDHPDGSGGEAVRSAAESCSRILRRLEASERLDEVRGLEGEAGQAYFRTFDHLIVAQKDVFHFSGRSRRPPLDSVNALLSFVYTLLTHDAVSALEGSGLDPQVGFLHRDRPGRPSLALDLVEELRAFLADRLVLSLINRQQVRGGGFTVVENGGVLMTDETRKTVLVAYQERKQEEITHPFLGDRTTVGMLVHLQALLLARFLRGDLDEYPSFFWR
jgi:CRISPR-associated protein Cas1